MDAEVKRALLGGCITVILAALIGFTASFGITAGIAWIISVIFGAAINYAIIAAVFGILYVLYAVSMIVLLTIEARS